MKILKIPKSKRDLMVKSGKITCDCGTVFKYEHSDCFLQTRLAIDKDVQVQDYLHTLETHLENYYCVKCPICGLTHEVQKEVE